MQPLTSYWISLFPLDRARHRCGGAVHRSAMHAGCGGGGRFLRPCPVPRIVTVRSVGTWCGDAVHSHPVETIGWECAASCSPAGGVDAVPVSTAMRGIRCAPSGSGECGASCPAHRIVPGARHRLHRCATGIRATPPASRPAGDPAPPRPAAAPPADSHHHAPAGDRLLGEERVLRPLIRVRERGRLRREPVRDAGHGHSGWSRGGPGVDRTPLGGGCRTAVKGCGFTVGPARAQFGVRAG